MLTPLSQVLVCDDCNAGIARELAYLLHVASESMDLLFSIDYGLGIQILYFNIHEQLTRTGRMRAAPPLL